MKTVQKFTSFEELKSSESKTGDNKSILKRHKEFEKVIKSIAKIHANNSQSK